MSEWRISWGRARWVRTEDIALVEAIGGDDCSVLALLVLAWEHCARRRGVLGDALVTRRLGWPAASMVKRRQTAAAGREEWCLRRGGSQSSPVCGTAISAVL